jgi:hypothetical protein
MTGFFGMLVRMNQGFSFGVNASPGSLVWVNRTEEQRVLEIKNEKLTSPTDTAATKSVAATVYTNTMDEKHTETSAPSLSLAVSWQAHPRLLLTAQTDYYLGSIYSYTSFTPDNGLQRSGFETFAPLKQTYTIEKNSVVDFSGGMEVGILKGYSVSLGGYTDYSQGPDDDRPASWDRNIDYFGGTLSLGMDKELTESRFGIGMAYGDAAITHFKWVKTAGGQPVVQVDPETGSIARVRRNFKALNFGLFLSSTLKI